MNLHIDKHWSNAGNRTREACTFCGCTSTVWRTCKFARESRRTTDEHVPVWLPQFYQPELVLQNWLCVVYLIWNFGTMRIRHYSLCNDPRWQWSPPSCGRHAILRLVDKRLNWLPTRWASCYCESWPLMNKLFLERQRVSEWVREREREREREISALSSESMKFALNAATDTLPHNANLALWRGLDDSCRLCGQRQTTSHILNHCEVASTKAALLQPSPWYHPLIDGFVFLIQPSTRLSDDSRPWRIIPFPQSYHFHALIWDQT